MLKAGVKAGLLLLLLLIIAAIGFWLWDQHHANETVVIKVGALLPSKSGDLVENREQMMNGMLLAKDYLEKKYDGRIKIEFYFEDGCFLTETVAAVDKFVQHDVPIIGASFCLFGHIPILQITEAYKIITFNTAANPDVTLNLHYAFSTNVSVKDEAQKLSEFAYKELEAKTAVVMHLDSPFGFDYYKYFTRDFSSRGGLVLADFPNAPDGKNFEKMIAEIKKLNPDVIVTAHFGLPLAKFIREVRESGIKAPILGNYETEDKTVFDYAGSSSDGVIFSTFELASKSSVTKRFESQYIRRFGVEPTVLAANTYDAVILSVEKYLMCKGERDCIADALHDVGNFDGVSGSITIGNDGATQKPIIFKTIKNRTFIPYHQQSGK